MRQFGPVVPANHIRTDLCDEKNQRMIETMLGILNLLGTFVGNLFKSRRRLEIENLFFRHQLNIALRRASRRLRLRGVIGRCWYG